MVRGSTSLWWASMAWMMSSFSWYFRANSTPRATWVPSISWSTALPRSWSRPARLAAWHVGAQLGGHQAGNVADLDGVLQHVLAVAGAVAQAAQHLHAAPGAGRGRRSQSTARSPSALMVASTSRLGLLHHLLDVGGMDAAVGDELLQSQPGDLPADGLEAGDGDGLRRVVDDQVHAGQGLQGADVAALAADDAALHLVIGQGNHTDGDLGHMVGGAALDGRWPRSPGRGCRPRP